MSEREHDFYNAGYEEGLIVGKEAAIEEIFDKLRKISLQMGMPADVPDDKLMDNLIEITRVWGVALDFIANMCDNERVGSHKEMWKIHQQLFERARSYARGAIRLAQGCHDEKEKEESR